MGSWITLDVAAGVAVISMARCYVEAYLTEDAREGIRAFLDKRPARFRGR